MLLIRAETTVSTYGSVKIARLKKKEVRNEQFGSFDKFQFGTSAMVASDFDGLRGYRTLEYEGQVSTKPYNCCFSRVSRLPFVLLHMAYCTRLKQGYRTISIGIHLCGILCD